MSDKENNATQARAKGVLIRRCDEVQSIKNAFGAALVDAGKKNIGSAEVNAKVKFLNGGIRSVEIIHIDPVFIA